MQYEIILNPIGVIHSDLKERYEAPRQGVLTGNQISSIELNPQENFEQALKGLEGFERIWVIYRFHLNNNWKPMVTPPRHTKKKVGVFATRAPYRPNQLGLSCVKVEKIDGLIIFITESDILDGSPVLDIKPYLPFSDSFPDVKTGWAKTDLKEIFRIIFSPDAELEGKKIKENSGANVLNYARVQLEFNPSDISRKRISIYKETSAKNIFSLTYQKWKIFYEIDEENRIVLVDRIK